MTVLASVLPVLSVLLGAAITYWLNVRQRRRNAVDDLFGRAIATVAAAEASVNYVSQVAPWRADVSSEEYQAFLKEVGREAALNHIRKVAEAREALAQVLPFQPSLDRFYAASPSEFLAQARELIDELRSGPADKR